MGCGNPHCGCDHSHDDGGCGNPSCACSQKTVMMEKEDINEQGSGGNGSQRDDPKGTQGSGESEVSGHTHDQEHDHVNAANPFANMDPETQAKIQELQMLEQNFQQLLMQKNAFSMEGNETDLIIREVEKTSGEVSRIIGGQVVVKSSKDEVLDEMKKKKDMIDNRMKVIDEQEKEFSEKLESLRAEVMAKFQA